MKGLRTTDIRCLSHSLQNVFDQKQSKLALELSTYTPSQRTSAFIRARFTDNYLSI